MDYREIQEQRNSLVQSRLKIARTFDYESIRALALDPKVYRHISDDSSDRESWQVPRGAQYIYLVALDEHESAAGFAAFLPRNGVMCEAHVCFLPKAYGEAAKLAFRDMLEWIWRNTRYRRIVGEIPTDNRLAIRFVCSAGVKPYGINRASKLRNGKLVDQLALGISRPY